MPSASNTKPWAYQGRGVVAPFSPAEINKSLRTHASDVNMKHMTGKDPTTVPRYFDLLHRVHADIIKGKIHTHQEIEDHFDALTRSLRSSSQPPGDIAGVGDNHAEPGVHNEGAPATDSGGSGT